jgi:hypothetical protein
MVVHSLNPHIYCLGRICSLDTRRRRRSIYPQAAAAADVAAGPAGWYRIAAVRQTARPSLSSSSWIQETWEDSLEHYSLHKDLVRTTGRDSSDRAGGKLETSPPVLGTTIARVASGAEEPCLLCDGKNRNGWLPFCGQHNMKWFRSSSFFFSIFRNAITTGARSLFLLAGAVIDTLDTLVAAVRPWCLVVVVVVVVAAVFVWVDTHVPLNINRPQPWSCLISPQYSCRLIHIITVSYGLIRRYRMVVAV